MEGKQVVSVTPRTARRAFSKQFKRELVRQAMSPGVSVAAQAQANEINPNQLSRWCREHQRAEGAMEVATLVPVNIASGVSEVDLAPQPAVPSGEIEWRHGSSSVVVRGNVDPQIPRAIISQTLASACRMIGIPPGTQVWLVAGATDMRRGFDGLAAVVQTKLASNPYGGQAFVFRGRRGDRIKVLWWDGQGLCLLCKRLEQGYFVWPQADSGSVHLSAAQLSMLLEGIDWRRPQRTSTPCAA